METPKNEDNILQQLTKARKELSTLFEISNAMHKTLELEEILFIILTGVTSHSGLGFNRAMLMLLGPQGRLLEGKIGIGPDDGEEAKSIWNTIDNKKMNLDDLVNSYANTKDFVGNSKFFNLVKNFQVPAQEPEGGILAKAFNEGLPLHIKKENYVNFEKDPLFSVFTSDECVVVPLKARDKTIVADNFFTKRLINKDEIRILVTFANQAGMAIENSKLYERTLNKAHRDSLTDLWNHGYFQFILEKKLRLAKDSLSFLSLIMLDIDNFKNYNDTWGHQKGDKILEKISQIIVDSSRKVDCVCRYGGEEFAVVLPDASRKDGLIIAERIRSNIENFKFSEGADHPVLKITVSVGIASFPDDGNKKSELIQAADKALYEAKRSGKNKVCCASQNPSD